MKTWEMIAGIALAVSGAALAVSAIREDTTVECVCECSLDDNDTAPADVLQ